MWGCEEREKDSVIVKVVLCERVVIAVSAYRLFFPSFPKKRKSHVLKIPFNGNQSLNISIALFYYSADSQALAARLTAEEKKSTCFHSLLSRRRYTAPAGNITRISLAYEIFSGFLPHPPPPPSCPPPPPHLTLQNLINQMTAKCH